VKERSVEIWSMYFVAKKLSVNYRYIGSQEAAHCAALRSGRRNPSKLDGFPCTLTTVGSHVFEFQEYITETTSLVTFVTLQLNAWRRLDKENIFQATV
jgi:hypothetical protein